MRQSDDSMQEERVVAVMGRRAVHFYWAYLQSEREGDCVTSMPSASRVFLSRCRRSDMPRFQTARQHDSNKMFQQMIFIVIDEVCPRLNTTWLLVTASRRQLAG